MNRNKNCHLMARNWEVLAELDETHLPQFEKLHTHREKAHEDSSPNRLRRPRQDFQRSRFS